MLGFQLIKLSEPQFSKDWLVNLNNWANSSNFWQHLVPILADAFVFAFPVVLLAMYVAGILKNKKNYKYGALYTFFSSISIFLVNFAIQLFVSKDRPEQFFNSKTKILIKHIPDNSFPSDHAAMGAAFASALTFWAFRTNNQKLKNWAYVMWILDIIMCVCRIAAGVHWPTDIIAGTLIGIFCAYILNRNFEKLKTFYNKIINIEEKITKNHSE